ncbi:hypothetical protein [Janthinobacterium sp.]|uniref:hypothetical protein n=1 Tax=Janthinobacterium sp. TaxID=1871054 RepID=UPI0025C17C3D|nr:hypothetical protein [Janthinobacterium sp.]NBV19956.1 hypothetical protein [Janthinobacterium sp.]
MSEAEGAPGAGEGQPETRTSDDAVPAWKFVKIKKERDTYAGELEALRAELQTTRTAAEAGSKHVARISELEEELGLVRVGLSDPEAVDVARTLYRRLPDDKRPASITEWVTSIKEAPPKALAGYLGTPAAEVAAPPRPTGNGRQPEAGGQPTADAIRNARLKAMGTPAGSPEWQEFERLSNAARRR